MAREILAEIETFDADESAEAPPFLAELGELLERAKATGPEGGAGRDRRRAGGGKAGGRAEPGGRGLAGAERRVLERPGCRRLR